VPPAGATQPATDAPHAAGFWAAHPAAPKLPIWAPAIPPRRRPSRHPARAAQAAGRRAAPALQLQAPRPSAQPLVSWPSSVNRLSACPLVSFCTESVMNFF